MLLVARHRDLRASEFHTYLNPTFAQRNRVIHGHLRWHATTGQTKQVSTIDTITVSIHPSMAGKRSNCRYERRTIESRAGSPRRRWQCVFMGKIKGKRQDDVWSRHINARARTATKQKNYGSATPLRSCDTRTCTPTYYLGRSHWVLLYNRVQQSLLYNRVQQSLNLIHMSLTVSEKKGETAAACSDSPPPHAKRQHRLLCLRK